MGSVTGQPQLPSKVLHLRNLPYECTEEEVLELGRPFGSIVKTKLHVGTNRNQAFVEFADMNQAISMVSYYANSSETARLRGRPVYLQYSNRHEIVNGKNAGDEASNVLLVTLEGVEAGDVSIDVLHVVFSAFGFVHKIATFDKGAGFQALVQFSDADTASSARSTLDGRSIPRYLLPEHIKTCHLRITFSAHTDLNIKFQSYRSRDYTNPNLPVAPSALDGSGQFGVGPDGQRRVEPESNVILASMENMLYEVNVEVLHTVFSPFGNVQKILIFEKNGGTKALIQYADVTTAALAKETLEGHCVYEGGYCKLHLSYSRHTDLNLTSNNERSRDYTLPTVGLLPLSQAPIIGPQAPVGPVAQTSSAVSVYSGNQFVYGSGVSQNTAANFVGPVSNPMPNQTGMIPPVPAAPLFASASVPPPPLGLTNGFSVQTTLPMPPSSAPFFPMQQSHSHLGGYNHAGHGM